MVSESLKFGLKPETRCFLDAESASQGRRPSHRLCVWVLPLIVIAATLAVSILALLKTYELQQQVDFLRNELEKGQAREELFDDIRKFEEDELSADDMNDQTINPFIMGDDDDLDWEYEMNYDDEDDDYDIDTPNNLKKNDNHGDDLLNKQEDLLLGGSITKVGQETKRTRRDIIGSTFEGVPINAEPYVESKKRNRSLAQPQNSLLQEEVFRVDNSAVSSGNGHQSSSPTGRHHARGIQHHEQKPNPAVLSRRSRVMHAEKSRRDLKTPQLKSGSRLESAEELPGSDFTIVRDEPVHHRRNRNRQRNNLETFDEKPRGKKLFPAIHFSGDTSKYVMGRHTNYNGDGHLRHPDQTYVDWAPSGWVTSLNMDEHFQMQEGRLRIKESGLYFVYAQIYYLDQHDTNGYRVYRNQETLLQCTTMTHSTERVMKSNTCYTAGVEYLNEGDQISLKDLADGRYSLFEIGKSFFGVVKLGDVRIK